MMSWSLDLVSTALPFAFASASNRSSRNGASYQGERGLLGSRETCLRSGTLCLSGDTEEYREILCL